MTSLPPTPAAGPTPTPEATELAARIRHMVPLGDHAEMFELLYVDAALLIDQHVATRTAQLTRERDEAVKERDALNQSAGREVAGLCDRIRAAESTTQQLTTRCAELERKNATTLALLERYKKDGGELLVKREQEIIALRAEVARLKDERAGKLSVGPTTPLAQRAGHWVYWSDYRAAVSYNCNGAPSPIGANELAEAILARAATPSTQSKP